MFLLMSINISAQVGYSGYIDKYAVELVTNIYSDGVARAVYCYTKHDEPIIINGTLKNDKLTLFETGIDKKNTATLTFENFDADNPTLNGIWTDLKTKKQLPIVLTKDNNEGEREIIQTVSIGSNYFKLGLSYGNVTAIKIIEKKTDKLVQKINVECQLWGLENISVDDFNFDGIPDFSVFEGSYAGPNTTSLYFLYNPKTKKYFNSGFSGVSLEFNAKTKTIFERNQCCAGSIVTTAEYKVVNNKMVLKKQRCFKWDEKKNELVERPIKECD